MIPTVLLAADHTGNALEVGPSGDIVSRGWEVPGEYASDAHTTAVDVPHPHHLCGLLAHCARIHCNHRYEGRGTRGREGRVLVIWRTKEREHNVPSNKKVISVVYNV